MASFGGRAVPYPLNEDMEWGLAISDLKAVLDNARANSTNVKALVVINPGNPTGQCLSADNMKEVPSSFFQYE